MTDQSAITYHNGGTTFTGDGIELYRAATLRSALKLYAACGMIPTRGFTITKMLKLATQYTGKPYKRGDAAKAAADMKDWVDAAKAAMPVIDERT